MVELNFPVRARARNRNRTKFESDDENEDDRNPSEFWILNSDF